MKFNYLRLLAAALTLSFTAVSCDDATSSDEENGGDDNQTQTEDYFTTSPFTLAAEEITPVGFTLSVDCGSYDTQYYVGCVFKSDVEDTYAGDYDAMADAFLADVVGNQLEVTDFSQVDNWKIFRGNAKVDMEAAWEVFLNPESEVVAFVFGVNNYGEMTTKVEYLEVTMDAQIEPVDATPEIKLVGESGPTSFTVEVDPGDKIVQYIVVAFLAKDAAEDGYYDQMAEFNSVDKWDFAAEDMLSIKTSIDFNDVDNVDLFSGVQEVTLTQSGLNNVIYPNEEYTVIAFGVDQYGFLASKVGYLNVTTAEPAQVDFSFNVTFDEESYTDDGFKFTVSATPANEWYYINVYEKEAIDKIIEKDDYDREDIYALFNGNVQYDLTYGEVTRTYGYLSDYTYYYVVLFGYNGGMTSEVTLVECKTGSWQDWE